MTATILRFDRMKVEPEPAPQPEPEAKPPPHTAGPLLCDRCGHRIEYAETPIGTKFFKCPACDCMAMKRQGPVLPADGETRQACPDCRGQVFSVTPASLICADCGTHVSVYWGKQ